MLWLRKKRITSFNITVKQCHRTNNLFSK